MKCPRPNCNGKLFPEYEDYGVINKCCSCAREFDIFGTEIKKPVGAKLIKDHCDK